MIDFILYNIIYLIYFVWGFFLENNKNNILRKEFLFSFFNKLRIGV